MSGHQTVPAIQRRGLLFPVCLDLCIKLVL